MPRSLFLLIVLLCLGYQTSAKAEDEWNPSILSAQTIETIRQHTTIYHRCLEETMSKLRYTNFDSRNASSWVVKQCENRLDPIRSVLLEKKVPVEIANRYLLRKRHQAARQVLQALMFAESRQPVH